VKQIAILGGAFNPITRGHIQIAEFVKNTTDIDEVWIMPCHEHALKDKILPPYCRLELCRIATKGCHDIKVSDEEIKWGINNRQPIGSYYFLECLISKYHNKYSFRYIIGSDNANNMPRWVKSDKIRELIPFITVSRQGTELNEDGKWCKKSPHLHLESNGYIDDVSSTEIRELIKEGEYGKAFTKLNPDIYNTIIRDKLYEEWE